MSRMVSFAVLVGIIAIIGFLFYRVMAGFLLPLFLAVILVVMFRPLHRWFLVKCKGKQQLAAGLTTFTVMVIVLAPATLILTTAALEARALIGILNDTELMQKLESRRRELGLEMPFPDELRFFEAGFQGLADKTSGGAMEALSVDALYGLKESLTAFKDKLRTTRYEVVLPAFEPVMTSFEEGMDYWTKPASARPAGGSVENHAHFEDALRQFRHFKIELLGSRIPHDPASHEGPREQEAPSTAAGIISHLVDLINQKELTAGVVELLNPSDQEFEELRSRFLVGATGWFRTIGGATGGLAVRIIVGMVIMVISLHFFLSDGPAMVTTMMRLSPLEDRHEQELLEEFDRVSRAVVVATLLSAVVQGTLGGIGYWFAGVGSVFLLTVLTGIFALIPFVGAAAVWIPVSLYLAFIEQRYLAGGLLALYGTGIVSMADNVIKPFVLHGQSNLHPLLALLSILGGVKALGPIGVLVGPIVVAFLQTLLNILRRELTTLEKS